MTADDGRRAAVRVSLFGGIASLPALAAQERDLFELAGLDVEVTVTTSSHDLMSGLVDGRFDVVHAAPDNFIEWRDRTEAPIVAWLGGAAGPLALFGSGRSGRSVGDLRDSSVAVDAVNSGFVLVLRDLLRRAGVDASEVTLEPLGSTARRFDALAAGTISATILTLPWASMARDRGLPELARFDDRDARLPGSCAGSLDSWLSAHREVASAYLRAICAATTWIRSPASADEVQEFIARRMAVDPAYVPDVLAALLDPVGGCPPSGAIDLGAFANLGDLRRRNGQAPRRDVSDYVSLATYESVFGRALAMAAPAAILESTE